MKRIIKQQWSSSSSWSDLELDMLREIDKKLCYADHIRFRGVCKSWRAAGREKRSGDVLPWLMTPHVILDFRFLYKLYEPPSMDSIKLDTITSTVLSGTINLGVTNLADMNDASKRNEVLSLGYVDGWLYMSLVNQSCISEYHFLFFSLATKASFTLPRLNNHHTLLALSTTPNSPDCVFLALRFTDCYTRTISIFRHGYTHWFTTKSVGSSWFGYPRYNAAVFIRGVFYFFFDVGIGSYDLATGELKVDRYSTMLESIEIHKFFGLDEDLMLAYMDQRTLKLCISKYDWSSKLWVPLQSLGGRSLYLSRHSVYIDQINYYGISSANKIYIRDNTTSCVDEYTLEDGQLSKCPARRLRSLCSPNNNTSWDIWVGPPDLLLRK